MVESDTFNKIVVSKHSRNGSVNEAKLSYNQLRSHCVSVRLNDEELTLLNEKRGRHRKGEWLRLSLLNKLPAVVPAINFEAWKTLGEISQKLNKLVAHLNSKSYESPLTQTELFAVKRQVSELRLHLITADLWRASHEGDAEDKAR
ncbi:Uncharacterised protein [Klebsiella pneumoniae]|uniref:Uncharacterized protein n=1 Tax=Salmonella enterica subsp. enterica serovar Weslaco TaxID=1243597 RepID=A0A5X3P5F9_SALET|nr:MULTISPECIES: hypothetical protein [Enterobacteriaceae]EBZ5931402.1 hypothetical protein [Salmonella enterica subsp. enterica serovar Weslaco]EIX9032558.1 hypothetical protein [Klebsiella aerogenes]EBZ6052464.1 hypothetical protein [Salmonella enterica subsp. enterica serovar Weslaco]EBZ6063592.1 hypothetical protein [Salmonella enterica subsp. enterica serovar Weslaco]EBZ6070547.1 hypothetical protein [Salmonella enterica subsp. enterica serovar Weslaco]